MPRLSVARRLAALALAFLTLAALAAPAGAADLGDGSAAQAAFATLRADIGARVAQPYRAGLLAKANQAEALASGPAPNLCASAGTLRALDQQAAALVGGVTLDQDSFLVIRGDIRSVVAILFPTDPLQPGDPYAPCLPPNPVVTP